jgi:hypothetical protein
MLPAPHRTLKSIAAVDVELADDDLREIEAAATQIGSEGARYAEAQQRMIDRWEGAGMKATVMEVPEGYGATNDRQPSKVMIAS